MHSQRRTLDPRVADGRSKLIRLIRSSSVAVAGLIAGCQMIGDFESFDAKEGPGSAGAQNGVGGSGGASGADGAGASAGNRAGRGGESATDSSGAGGAGASGDDAGGRGATGGGAGATAGANSGTGGNAVGGTGDAGGDGGMSSGCGDASRDNDEACDDGNSSACGTCSADCRTATPLAPPRGTITVVAGTILDRETFTLHDGFGAVVFEFDNNGTLEGGGGFAINFATGGSTDELRDATIAAINGGGGLAITAERGAGAGVIALTNDHMGSAGNIGITDRVGSPAFTYTGMSGGAGYDCPLGTGCFFPEDCDSTICVGGICRACTTCD